MKPVSSKKINRNYKFWLVPFAQDHENRFNNRQ